MQNAELKRRCSILKKRRSRSLSPKPLAETKPRRSRRISFSGKNAVREFIGASENKETIWVASYEESTENHQYSTHLAIASSTMHSNKNDTISMPIDMDIDCSDISFIQSQQKPSKQSLISRPSNVSTEQTIEKIAVSQHTMKVDQITRDDSNSKNSKLSMFQQLLKLQEQQQQQEQQEQQEQKKQEPKQMPVPRVFQTNKIDMEMSTIASEQQIIGRTIVHSRDISMDNSLDMPNSGHLKNNCAISKPTNRNTVFDAKNMSLDFNQSNTGSFDLNKTNQHTADMSIMMERQPVRGTVIFKSPKKGTTKSLEKTVVFDADIEVTDVTMGMRNISYHPIQMGGQKRNVLTLMDSIAVEATQPTEKQSNVTVNDELEMDESFVQKTDTMPSVKPTPIFNQIKCTTTYSESMPVEMSITQPVPIKKTSLHLLPMLSHADKENDPRIIDMLNIDASAASANDDMSLDNTLKSESAIIENVFETKSLRRTIFDQNSLEMSDASDDLKPEKKVNSNKMPFIGGIASGRNQGSLELNESIDINDTLKSVATKPMSNIVRIDKKRQTIHYNESLELSNVSFDIRGEMVAESTGKIPSVVDQSKNMSLDLDDIPLEANFSMRPPATTNGLLNRIKRATTFANQSIEMSDNSMEQTHPNPAKKCNPNKTPFYFNEEKRSDLEISIASNSSIMNLDDTLQKQGTQLAPKIANNFETKLQRRTELFHESINDNDKDENMSIHADVSMNVAAVISDSSNMNISNGAPIQGENRTTCYQQVSMVQDDVERLYANRTKTHQKTIVIDDDDDNEERIVRPIPKRINHGTIYKNESMLLEDKSISDQSNVKVDSCCYLTDIGEADTPSEKSKSSIIIVDTSLQPSKLSFYDEDDDDYLCNTKPQLIESYENVSNEDVARNISMATKRSLEHQPANIIDSFQSELAVEDECSETKEPITELSSKVFNMNEHEIFKKSTLLRRSGAHEEGPSIDDDGDDDNEQQINNASDIVENQPNIFKKPKSLPKMPPKAEEIEARAFVVDDQQQPSTSKQAKQMPSTSNRLHIQRPSIIRRSINCDGTLDETSFLMNMTDDKPASELKIDFSGYKKFEGLATIGDVLRNHQLRRNELGRQIEQWKYQLENNLPMEGIDAEDDSTEDMESQNVEAPSWTFLWRNKLKCEIEQMKLEIEREFAERPPGAFLPVAPDISILILNKCKQLKNWNFDELWYFKGNIRLRSIALPAFSIIILYDPDIEIIQRNADTYGALKFRKIVTEYCPKMCRIQSPCLHLKLRELRNLLPLNLTLMCGNSSELSAFDEKLNGLVMQTVAKIEHLKAICDQNHAFLKMEDGVIYIRKTMFCRRVREFQDYIIELNGIDTTDWHDVRTKPHRVLNEAVKALPKGMPFIEEFVANDKQYVPIVSME